MDIVFLKEIGVKNYMIILLLDGWNKTSLTYFIKIWNKEPRIALRVVLNSDVISKSICTYLSKDNYTTYDCLLMIVVMDDEPKMIKIIQHFFLGEENNNYKTKNTYITLFLSLV